MLDGFTALFTPETAKRVAKESVGLGLCGVFATNLLFHSKHPFPARHHVHPRVARPKARHEEHEEHAVLPHHPHQPPLELSR
jgi:hypothetical protein